jgi:hypothetical protein
MALGTLALLGIAATASAQRKSGAETGLIGIKLYDSGVRVVGLYGTPDEVQAVGGGGGSAPGPGGGGPAGGPAGGAAPALGPGGGGGGGRGSSGASSNQATPFSFGDEMLFQSRPATGGTTIGQGTGSKADHLRGSASGGGGGPAGGGRGPGAAGGGGGMTGDKILFTRWVYNRGGSKYGFVLDRFNRVVQVEAVGIQNNKVRTRRGIGFGATFAQIIKKYQAPDGYEVSGDTIVVRYLVKSKCAFRLSRLGPNKPQVVTGIVVAAGKA